MCFNDPVDGQHKVTAARIKEKMDIHFSGREELQWTEFEIQHWLQAMYEKVWDPIMIYMDIPNLQPQN